MVAATSETVKVALLGGGLFASDTYLPILKTLSMREPSPLSLVAVWSRSEGTVAALQSKAAEFAPSILAKHGDAGLEELLNSPDIHAVLVVLPVQVQLAVTERALRAGKHVLQEKPFSRTVEEGQAALERYYALGPTRPLFALAENYRFEKSLLKARDLVKELGKMIVVEFLCEAPMNAKNKYFSSQWRRDPAYKGGFLAEGGVHFVGGLRLVTDCEVEAVSALTAQGNSGLPAPDTVAALFQLSNGCAGVVTMCFSACSRKITLRIVCEDGTVAVERQTAPGQFGYDVKRYDSNGAEAYSEFVPFSGVEDEIATFAQDVAGYLQACSSNGGPAVAQSPLITAEEGLRDVAVMEAFMVSAAEGSSRQIVTPIPPPPTAP